MPFEHDDRAELAAEIMAGTDDIDLGDITEIDEEFRFFLEDNIVGPDIHPDGTELLSTYGIGNYDALGSVIFMDLRSLMEIFSIQELMDNREDIKKLRLYGQYLRNNILEEGQNDLDAIDWTQVNGTQYRLYYKLNIRKTSKEFRDIFTDLHTQHERIAHEVHSRTPPDNRLSGRSYTGHPHVPDT